MQKMEERLVYDSRGISDNEKDEDQRNCWFGITANSGSVRITMSGQQVDGRDVGEVEARFSREQLIEIRDFIDRQVK